MTLDAMTPDPAASVDEDAVAVFRRLAGTVTIRIWGGDWCPDTHATLPGFAATLAAAAVPMDDVEVIPVDRTKDGRLVDAYDITRIPTIVVEADGTELARFVESASVPPAVYLADQLTAAER